MHVLDDLFKPYNNIIAGVADKNIDAFLWETFTTKPFFDSGELHKVWTLTLT